MSFCIFGSDIALCSGDNVIIFNIQTNEEKIISLPKPETGKENCLHNKEDLETFHSTTNVVFSTDGEYLAICTNRKQLCIFERKSLHLVANWILVRAASKIRFTPKNDVVVADKSGDAYLYSIKHPTTPGCLLLGHLSMLLDILVTKDNEYIVTSDRDEKIRVSMFPNSYNIVSYCLAHTKFVTNISELPFKDSLISGGGDGFLRIWNYKTGEEKRHVNYMSNFAEDDVNRFNESLRKHDVTEDEVSLPLKHLKVIEMNDDHCIIVTSFYCSRKILIYKCTRNFEIDFVGEVEVDEEPLECTVEKNNLWILTNQKVAFFEWTKDGFSGNEEVDEKLRKLNESWRRFRNDVRSGILFPILYKRKYDNLQEYQERKKIRLNKTMET